MITLFGVATASAQAPVQKQLTVAYGDLDLSKEAGIRTLMVINLAVEGTTPGASVAAIVIGLGIRKAICHASSI